MSIWTDLQALIEAKITELAFVGTLTELGIGQPFQPNLLTLLTLQAQLYTITNTGGSGSTATPALVKRVTFTRTANTTSYAVDDQWGALQQLTSFGQANQGYLLTEVNLVSSLTTLPTGYGSFSLFFFKNSTDAGSGIADNDPMTRRTTAMHSTGIALSTVAAKAANDISCSSFTGDLRNQLVLEGTDIWLRLMTRAAITTPVAAADTITLDLRFVGI